MAHKIYRAIARRLPDKLVWWVLVRAYHEAVSDPAYAHLTPKPLDIQFADVTHRWRVHHGPWGKYTEPPTSSP